MPEAVVYLTDEQRDQLAEYARFEGKSLDQCMKDLAWKNLGDKLRFSRGNKAPTFELPKRESQRTDK